MSNPTERLLRCLRLDSAPGAAAEIASWPDDAWRAVVDDAVRHEVEALLHDRVARAVPPVVVPDDVLTRLRELYCCGALEGRRVHAELAAVLSRFREREVPVMVLKGAHLASAVYDDVALRPMADLDLLVRDGDLADAERLLLELGYGPRERPSLDAYPAGKRHLDPFTKPGATMIEVHRSVIGTDGPFRVDVAGLWQRARDVEIAGERALALGPEDLLVHLSLHAGYTHRFGAVHRVGLPLKHLCDVALSLQRYRAEIDWTLLADICAAWGAGRFVYCTIALARDLLGAEVDLAQLAAIPHEQGDAEMLGVLREQLLSPPLTGAEVVPKAYRQLTASDGGHGALRFMMAELLPPPVHLRKLYRLRRGSPWVYALYLFHPFGVLREKGGAATGALFRTRRFRPLVDRYEATGRLVDRWAEGRDSNK